MLQYKHTHGTISKICSIPEPDSLKHAHVIIPLADVTPEFVHPQVKKPLRVIAEEVSGRANFKSFFPTVKQSALQSDETCIFATKNSKLESHQKLFTQMKQSKVEEHAVESTDPLIGALGVNRFPRCTHNRRGQEAWGEYNQETSLRRVQRLGSLQHVGVGGQKSCRGTK